MSPDKIFLGIVSLGLSLLLWLLVSTQSDQMLEREFAVSIQYRGIPPGYVLVNAPEVTKIIAQGPAAIVGRLDSGDVHPYINLEGRKPGELTVPISLPEPGSDIRLRLNQPRASFRMERMESKVVDVSVQPRGLVPAGLQYSGATANPSRVMISGPESEIEKVVTARAMIGLETVRPGVAQMLEIEVLGPNNTPLPLAKSEPTRVNVFPAVAAAPTTDTILVQPAWKGQPPFPFRVASYEVTPKTLQLRGDSGELAGASVVSTEPIDLSALKADKVFEVKIVIPPGLESLQGNSATVSVKIVKD